MFVIAQRMVIGDKVYEPMYLTPSGGWSPRKQDAEKFTCIHGTERTMEALPQSAQFKYRMERY